MSSPLYVLEDNLVEVNALRDMSNGSFVNDAVVAGTLYPDNGSNRPDLANPVNGADGFPLDYVAGSDGRYQGNLSDALVLELFAIYHLNIVGSSQGRDLNRWIRCVAQEHKSRPART